MDSKQVIVIRRDLKMRRGKEISQGAHASMAWLTRRLIEHRFRLADAAYDMRHLSEAEITWIEGSFKKVVVQVDTETELRELEAKAKAAGLEAHLIIDSGLTEFAGVPTATALGIGPDLPAKIDTITSHLKLY